MQQGASEFTDNPLAARPGGMAAAHAKAVEVAAPNPTTAGSSKSFVDARTQYIAALEAEAAGGWLTPLVAHMNRPGPGACAECAQQPTHATVFRFPALRSVPANAGSRGPI